MGALGFDPAFDLHLPAGLWPVYVLGALVLLSLLYVVVLRAGGMLASYRSRATVLVVSAALMSAVAVGLYLHANARYRDCLRAGNHPWYTDHVERGRHICDRSVFGDVSRDALD